MMSVTLVRLVPPPLMPQIPPPPCRGTLSSCRAHHCWFVLHPVFALPLRPQRLDVCLLRTACMAKWLGWDRAGMPLGALPIAGGDPLPLTQQVAAVVGPVPQGAAAVVADSW